MPLGAFKVFKFLGDLRDSEGTQGREDNIGLHAVLFSSVQVDKVQLPLLTALIPDHLGDLGSKLNLFIEVVFTGRPSQVGPDLGLRCIGSRPVIVGFERVRVVVRLDIASASYGVKRREGDSLWLWFSD